MSQPRGASVGRRIAATRGLLRSGGAGPSGLASLTEMCAVNAAADALVAVALAGTVFFNVSPGEARGRVALYLLTTLAPFALLAPFIGPVLDRFHSRRLALGATLVVRAGLCWVMAGHTKGLELFPLALAVLVIGRGYGIARSAVTPRVLPPELTLVKANARVSLVGAIASGIVAPLGLGLQQLVGVDWVLRAATAVFLGGVVLATRLPAHVDSDAGESRAAGVTRATLTFSLRPSLGRLPLALRAVMPMRALVGFLTLFLAFALRSADNKAGLAGLGAAAVIGQSTGVIIGNRLGGRRPELLITCALVTATSVCVLGVLLDTTVTTILIAGAAVLSASLGKLCLDAVIQRDIAERVRTSAFARSETALQLSWVSGGALGLLPVSRVLGLAIAALGMVAALLLELTGLRAAQRRVEERGAD